MARQLVPKSGNITYHVNRIEDAFRNTREAFFDLVSAIKAAHDELGEDSFQKDLANRISISPASLTKYLKIANCKPLMKRPKSLPPTLTTLYDLTRLQSELVKGYGETKGEQKFNEVLKRVNIDTEANEIAPVILKAKERLSLISKRNREKNILGLSGATTSAIENKSRVLPWKSVLESKTVYRTIFMTPSEKTLRWMSDKGVFLNDIAERYSIADLRAPSQNDTIQGLVYCSANSIDAGLKLLVASGFTFRDIFFPSSGSDGFELVQNQKVLLRGERGKPVSLEMDSSVEASDDGALILAESLGLEPRLHVFASEARDGWTSTNPDRN